jgi:hypothetical protein
MIDVRILEAKGCSAKAWRKIFENRIRQRPLRKNGIVEDTAPKRDRIDALMERMWNRIIAGRDWNFSNFATIHAMDLIWDAPGRQVNPTLISSICAKHGKNTEDIKSALKGLGLDFDSVIVDTDKTDVKTGRPIQAVNVPSFFAIMVPLARAMATARRARVINERNREPFFEFKAATQSKLNRVRCEVLTSRVQESAKAYDYLGSLNQAVLQMFLYPTGCLVFTREEWDYVEQLRRTDGGKDEEYVVQEGLRYFTPHPSRMFWDMAHPMRTFNTDTGCEFAGYWQVMRYGDVLDNDGFYNKDKITIGNTGWFSAVPSFWTTVYSGCTLKIPSIPINGTTGEDREEYLATACYGGDMRDASMMLCEYREKLNPKQWGLGDYDYDVWCRFVVAGDGTIVYAAPVGYTPVCVFRDNGDDKRVSDASLVLQLSPYQDQLSNLFTQFLLTVKQNLANFTMVDGDVINTEMVKKLTNDGETYFRGLNIYTYSGKNLLRMAALQSDPRATAVISHRFPPLDTNGIVLAMKLMIDMAERVLQFSSQEVAQAASHEQTKAEINQVAASTTNIVEYTGIAIDAGMNAMAHQNYEALMNYGEDEFYAQIPSDHELSEEKLRQLGITQDEDDKEETHDKKIRVKAKKSAMQLNAFATVPPSNKRQTSWEAAQAISQFYATILQNPVVQMALGPQQMVEIANQIAKLAGLHLDADLRDMTEENQKKQASDLLKQAVDAVLGIVRTETKHGLEVIMSEIKDLATKVNGVMEALGLNATATPNTPAGPDGAGSPSIVAPVPVGPPVPAVAPNAMPLGAA